MDEKWRTDEKSGFGEEDDEVEGKSEEEEEEEQTDWRGKKRGGR
jgi:hypothetical protein